VNHAAVDVEVEATAAPPRVMVMVFPAAAILVLLLLAPPAPAPQPPPLGPHPFQDFTLGIEERLDDLVGRLNQSELIGQLTETRTMPIPRLGIRQYSFYGACLSGFDDGSVVGPNVSTTAFPSPITRGASWDAPLERRITSAVGDEVRGVFAVRGFGAKSCNGPPGCNVWRDPRWGRAYESYSEEPLVIAKLAAAAVLGLQKGLESERASAASGYLKAAAGARHLGVYSLECTVDPMAPAGPNNTNLYPHCGVDRSGFNADVDDIDLHEIYMPGYRAAVEANVSTVMCSTNSFRGTPACANGVLLKDLLKDTWGFDGYVDPDDGSCLRIWQSTMGAWKPQDGPQFNHGFEHSPAAAITACFNGGSDLGDHYAEFLPSAINEGLVKTERLRDSAKRQFRIRMRLGEFDPPVLVPWTKITAEQLGSAAHRQLAREAAVAGMTLVKNDHGILPLSSTKKQRILLLGAHASYRWAPAGVDVGALCARRCNETSWGPGGRWGHTCRCSQPAYYGSCCTSMPGDVIERYTGHPAGGRGRGIPPLIEGLRSKVSSAVELDWRLGANVSGHPEPSSDPSSLSARRLIEDAVAAAKNADLVILTAGGWRGGESHDRLSIGVMPQTEALARAIVATGKPMVSLLYGDGSALSSPYLMQKSTAVLSVFVPGEAHGDAVADVILGRASPSGALPVTVYTPEYAEAVDFLDHSWRGQSDGIGRGDRYISNRSYVMLPFGFALEYSSVHVSLAKPDNSGAVTVGLDGVLPVNVSITNTGRVHTISKTVQLMLREKGVLMPNRANRWLGAFAKVHNVSPGETKVVELEVQSAQWSRFDAFSQAWRAHPGTYEAFLLQSCCPACAARGCPACTCPELAAETLEFTVVNAGTM
jgi:beta-glucosidase